MSSLVGNAAAHRALYPRHAFSIREAMLYEAQAEDFALARHWNDLEIEIFREKSTREAINEIRRREHDYRGRKFQDLVAVAKKKIDQFIAKELRR